MDEKTYKANWQKLLWSCTKYLLFTLLVTAIGVLAIRLVASGFDFASAFKYVNKETFFSISKFLGVFLLLMALYFIFHVKITAITLVDGCIQGRNYWYFKKRIKVSEILGLHRTSQNGLDVIIADGGKAGEIYISMETYELEELLYFIEQENPSLFNS